MRGDPYWLTARFDSKCQCGTPIKKGQRAFYYPNGKRILCAGTCGEKASREFEAARQDEAVMAGGFA